MRALPEAVTTRLFCHLSLVFSEALGGTLHTSDTWAGMPWRAFSSSEGRVEDCVQSTTELVRLVVVDESITLSSSF